MKILPCLEELSPEEGILAIGTEVVLAGFPKFDDSCWDLTRGAGCHLVSPVLHSEPAMLQIIVAILATSAEANFQIPTLENFHSLCDSLTKVSLRISTFPKQGRLHAAQIKAAGF